MELAKTLDELLVVAEGKAVSRLQKIKANPSKASAKSTAGRSGAAEAGKAQRL